MDKPVVATVFGTRPEIIKMAPLIPLLDSSFNNTFIFTSQHYSANMVKIFFKELDLRMPDQFLNVQSSDYNELQQATEKALIPLNPDYVIVYGDTNSTLAIARATKKLKKKLIHMEAGLRSYDPHMPEEYNRIETDRLSDYLFAPTELCRRQLAKEGLRKNVFVVGNLIVDACRRFAPRAPRRDPCILVTVHRQENVDNPKKLVEILQSLNNLNEPIVFPAHPRTQKRIKEQSLKIPSNVRFMDAIGYIEFLGYLKSAKLVITDAGGVQEEAITLNVPCLTIRGGNERWEAIREGGNFLVGTEPALIEAYTRQILEGDLGEKMRKAKNPYGENVAQKTIQILQKELRSS